jgi:putative transposase
VADEIHKKADQHYELYAYCIMPNHVHLLILSLIEKFPPSRMKSAISPVAEIMRLLKGRAARYCNLALNRQGYFWHHESYDHYVRDEKEMERIILYILEQPRQSGAGKRMEGLEIHLCQPQPRRMVRQT